MVSVVTNGALNTISGIRSQFDSKSRLLMSRKPIKDKEQPIRFLGEPSLPSRNKNKEKKEENGMKRFRELEGRRE